MTVRHNADEKVVKMKCLFDNADDAYHADWKNKQFFPVCWSHICPDCRSADDGVDADGQKNYFF